LLRARRVLPGKVKHCPAHRDDQHDHPGEHEQQACEQ
jgi:hypothetical protein